MPIKRFAAILMLLPAALMGLALAVSAQERPAEVPVQPIALAGPVADADAEVSGLAWYGDHLLLLVENPYLWATSDYAGMFYTLRREDLLTYLLAAAYGLSPEPLEPTPLPIVAPSLALAVPGFDGFEAVAFVDDRAFLLIEARDAGAMVGYLVAGTVAPDLSAITLDLEQRLTLPAQTDIDNLAYESLLLADERLVALYEANGAALNDEPLAYVISTDLEAVETVPLAHVEYRLTDATAPDAEGVFWAINYFFPGDTALLPESDPLAERYGQGASHSQHPHVERLVALQYGEDGITLLDTAPLQLALPDEDARNWEGIARLDGLGFLLVTDKYPTTILAFVPWGG